MIGNQAVQISPSVSDYSRRDQIQYFAVIGISTLTLSVARWLQPSPNGYGTHQQLGLPPCLFFKLTGIPCPSCGLTTSFAHTVRFHFYEAFLTQPFGLIACLATAIFIPFCFWMMYRRIPWMKLLTSRRTNIAMYTGIVLFLAGWIYKIFSVR